MSLQADTLNWLKANVCWEQEYLQAAEKICTHIVPIVNANEAYKKHNVLQRLLMPQRVFQFSVEWEDDDHASQINTGWRVQHNNALGPYKGGTRFHPSVNLSILKFLGLEQSFKNSLTGLPIGAGKGGANFDPKRHSAHEIRRFCKAYMRALYRHIGDAQDVPAGDINVSEREIGFLFAEYLQQTRQYDGALSGKPIVLGGSQLRKQATGFGVAYFIEDMLSAIDEQVEGKRINISGAGNVALHAAQKLIKMGACVQTLSNSRGLFCCTQGLTEEHLTWLEQHADGKHNALKEMAKQCDGEFKSGAKPWSARADIAIPCATQNEIDELDAQAIIQNTQLAVVEGANMPCTKEASESIQFSNLMYVPGKAANAGGVILSAYEMQQNAALRYETESSLDQKLRQTVSNIHQACINESRGLGNSQTDYLQGATVAGFRRLADALVAMGY